jgi:hypothetical protein
MVEFTTLIAKPIPLLQFVFFGDLPDGFLSLWQLFIANQIISCK